MKKLISVIIMILLVLAAGVVGSLVLAQSGGSSQPEEKKEKQDNPNQPDLDYLSEVGLEAFVSNLPVLMIDTDGAQIYKEQTTWATVTIMDDESGQNDILGQADDVLTATVKYRGASSYTNFDKPQFRIKFYKEKDGKALEYSLAGMDADSEWVLNGPFLDRTLLRNYLMYNLCSETMEWAPHCRFIELFVNGIYQGVYLVVEPVTASEYRLGLSEYGLVSGATAYIVKRDREGTEDNVIHTYGETAGYTSQQLSVEYPGVSDLTSKQLEWIEQDISEFESALYSDYFDDPEIGYAAYIDVDSFVDYFILNEFSMNEDASYLSTFIYKEMEGKIKLCVWDYNNAFDNYQAYQMSTEAFCVVGSNWYDRLLQDRAFVERIVERYKELRSTILSDEHIASILNEGLTTLGDAIDRNFAVWGYTFHSNLLVDENGVERDPTSFEEALSQLNDVISRRLKFLDENIESLYEDCIN